MNNNNNKNEQMDKEIVARLNKEYDENQMLAEIGGEDFDPRFFASFDGEDGANVTLEMPYALPSLDGISEVRFEAKYYAKVGVINLGSVTGTMYSPTNMIQVIRDHIKKAKEHPSCFTDIVKKKIEDVTEIHLTLMLPEKFICYIHI